MIKAFLRFRSQSILNFGHNSFMSQIMPYSCYIILNNSPVYWEYEITDLFHRTWAILYATQYYFISPRVLGYHHCFASQAMLFLIVLLRRLTIIVLYRTYSWQPSKFNNGFNSYTKINHLRHILSLYSVFTAEHASVAIVWYSEGKVQYPG